MKTVKILILSFFFALAFATTASASTDSVCHEDMACWDSSTMGNLIDNTDPTMEANGWQMWEDQQIATTLPLTTHSVEYVGYGTQSPDLSDYPQSTEYTFYVINDGYTFHTFKVIAGDQSDAYNNMIALGWLVPASEVAPAPETSAPAASVSEVPQTVSEPAPASALPTPKDVATSSIDLDDASLNCANSFGLGTPGDSECINEAILHFGEYVSSDEEAQEALETPESYEECIDMSDSIDYLVEQCTSFIE